MMPATAQRFILSLGIMEDAKIVSPKQTEKGQAKNIEEAKKAADIVRKLAQEKK